MIQLRITVVHKVLSPINGIKSVSNDIIKEKFSRLKKKFEFANRKVNAICFRNYNPDTSQGFIL